MQNVGDYFYLFIKKKTFLTPAQNLGDTGKISSDFLKSRVERILEPAGLIPFQSQHTVLHSLGYLRQ